MMLGQQVARRSVPPLADSKRPLSFSNRNIASAEGLIRYRASRPHGLAIVHTLQTAHHGSTSPRIASTQTESCFDACLNWLLQQNRYLADMMLSPTRVLYVHQSERSRVITIYGLTRSKRHARVICPSCYSVATTAVDCTPKSKAESPRLVPLRGVSRSSRTLERDAVDADSAFDEWR